MQPFIDHARLFGQRPEEFAHLGKGQSPHVLFITCSDSRVVPPYASATPTGERATIEYTVRLLGCQHIVAVPAVRDCLAHAAREPAWLDPGAPTVAEAGRNHVLTQVEQLRSCPCVVRYLEAGELRSHAWYYEVHTGTVREHRPQTDTFETL